MPVCIAVAGALVAALATEGFSLIELACARVYDLPLSEQDTQRFGIDHEWCTPEAARYAPRSAWLRRPTPHRPTSPHGESDPGDVGFPHSNVGSTIRMPANRVGHTRSCRHPGCRHRFGGERRYGRKSGALTPRQFQPGSLSLSCAIDRPHRGQDAG